jgi:hypothetical protein
MWSKIVPKSIHRTRCTSRADRYEVQIEKKAGRLCFQDKNRYETLTEISSSLLRKSVNPLDTLSSLVKKLQQDGKDVSVSEYGLLHGDINFPEQIRENIIYYAISALKNDVNCMEKLNAYLCNWTKNFF